MKSRQKLANAIRVLSMDAVEKANSGHPGMPMGMADIAEVLWNDFLKHNPQNPDWDNRDRFILSNGHGSMLHYSLLHLSGYAAMSLEQIKNFRQLHSLTPGHPEHELTPGIETTTGPLGQGIANGVGMALAEKLLAAQFNRPGFAVVDHYTYVFMGDGCLMEGISHEACSLAGQLKLGKLIAFWDDNGISIDGEVKGWFSDDTPKRFEAYGWQVIGGVDGHDADAIRSAIEQARAETHKPTLICCKTIIGFGSPNLAGSSDTHGAPLGAAEIALVRERLGWSYPAFEIPQEIYEAFDARGKGQAAENEWQASFNLYRQQFPELAHEFERRMKGELPEQFADLSKHMIQACAEKAETIASRKASLNCLNALAPFIPEMVGGSADLTGSNLTQWKDAAPVTANDASGRYVYYGVREFGMFAIMNGMALHGGIIPFGGTFLVFSDYGRNAIRLSALMKQKVIYVLTHDSIGLGEDGPTHQPIEHAASLRLIPHLSVWRPGDAVETAVAWQQALIQQKPTALLLSRQNLPAQSRNGQQIANIAKGGYILCDSGNPPELILIATGSEVDLAVQAYNILQQEGHSVRVVSMPSVDAFEAQSADYQEQVLPNTVRRRIAIEAGQKDYWYRYVGLDGAVIGLDRFGESAPAKAVFEYLGFSVERVVQEARRLLN